MQDKTIDNYEKSKSEIDRLYNNLEVEQKATETEKRRLKYDVYDPKIYELESEKNCAVRQVEEDFKAKIETPIKANIETLMQTVRSTERILSLMEILRSEKSTDFEVYTYENSKKNIIKPFVILADDDFKKLCLYIAENGKPVNKFSLVLRGRSIFSRRNDKTLLHKNYNMGSWVTGLNDDGVNVELTIREAHTQDELMEWYNKHANNIKEIVELLADHKKTEEEYKEAVTLYESKEWKEATIKYLMRYYEVNYSRSTETKEYKTLSKELNALRGGSK